LAALCQSSLVAITAWSEERTSVSVGLASAFAMPYCASDGPVATIATVLSPRRDHEAADHHVVAGEHLHARRDVQHARGIWSGRQNDGAMAATTL
jgi:hypothetical protein